MAAADVLSPPSPPDLEVLEDERVLGASTADQVLERWHGFMAETSKLLQLDEPLRWRLPLQHVVTKATVTTATATDWSSQLGLSFSPVGRVVHSLAASVEQARNCVDMGPKLYHALAVFGEVLGPESPEEDSLQTPSELLVEVAELLPTLRQARHLLRRVEAVAENLLRQLSQTYTMAMPGLVRQPLRVVLDVLGELLAVPVFLDGLILENARLRRAFTSYNWIVEKAGAKAGGGSASLPDLPEATALLRELQEAQPLLRGDAFQMCLANVAQALNMRGHAFREQLSSYFRGRMEESELRGAVATSQLWQPAEEVRAKLKPQRASEAPSDALRLCGEALRRILAGEQNASRAFFDVGGIALALCCSGRSESASAGVGGRWRELRIVSQWQEQLRSLCDTSWCYWMRDLLPTLLSDLRVPSLPPLFAALAQPLENLPEGRARQAFLKELRRALEESIVQPLCAKLDDLPVS
eukprot:g742.t1